MKPEDKIAICHNLIAQLTQFYGSLLQDQIHETQALRAALEAKDAELASLKGDTTKEAE